MKKEVTIGVLFNNGYKDLNNLLFSFHMEVDYIKEFIIVSNRTDDLYRFNKIIENHSNIFKIRVDYNIINTGASGGRNKLLNLCNTKYMMFCDCDATINKGSLKILLDTIKKYKHIYVVTPKIYFGGTNKIWWGGKYGKHYFSIIHGMEEDNGQINWELMYGDLITTCALIDINIWSNYNIQFDEEFFIYGEEPEIVERMGNKVSGLFQPDALAYHHVKLEVTGKYFDTFRHYITSRNNTIIRIKQLDITGLLIGFKNILKLSELQFKLKIRAILYGIKLGLFKLFGFYKGKIIDSREYKFIQNLSKNRLILR